MSRVISRQMHTSSKKIIIFGGSGYIGQYIARRAVEQGLRVTSVSRKGAPGHPIAGGSSPDWAEKVQWEKGDVMDFSSSVSWRRLLKEQDGAVSCIGAFGSNEFMEKINGHANVNIVKLCREEGMKNFVYISANGDQVPSFLLSGYFQGKRLADQAVSSSFGSSGVIMRPGFVYGSRPFGSINLPLQLVGRPLEWILCSTGLSQLSIMATALPISVETLASVAVKGAVGGLPETDKSLSHNENDAKVLSHDDMISLKD